MVFQQSFISVNFYLYKQKLQIHITSKEMQKPLKKVLDIALCISNKALKLYTFINKQILLYIFFFSENIFFLFILTIYTKVDLCKTSFILPYFFVLAMFCVLAIQQLCMQLFIRTHCCLKGKSLNIFAFTKIQVRFRRLLELVQT